MELSEHVLSLYFEITLRFVAKRVFPFFRCSKIFKEKCSPYDCVKTYTLIIIRYKIIALYIHIRVSLYLRRK